MDLAELCTLKPQALCTQLQPWHRFQMFPFCANATYQSDHSASLHTACLPTWSHFVSRLLEISNSREETRLLKPEPNTSRQTTCADPISPLLHTNILLQPLKHVLEKPLRAACSVTCYITYHSQSHRGSVTNRSCIFHFLWAMRSL